MPRPVYCFNPTWQDQRYKKALKRLSPQQQEECLKEIADLIKALSVCTHPKADPILQRWKPGPYKRVIKQTGLYEYRCRGLTRVVARFIEADPSNQVEEVVLMLTVTLTHDHERMQRLIQRHKQSISTWTPKD